MLDEEVAGQLQGRDRLFTFHRREMVEKTLKAVASGKVVE